MIVYKRKVSHSIGKWFLAIAIFIATMTITWNDVEGKNYSPEIRDQIQLTK